MFGSILLKVAGWNILRAAACAKMREIVCARAIVVVFWLNFAFFEVGKDTWKWSDRHASEFGAQRHGDDGSSAGVGSHRRG